MKIRNDNLPYCRPFSTELEEEYVVKAIKSKWWSTGEITRTFENEFKKLCKCNFSLGVNSCTAALHLGLKVLGVQKGDEVITVSMTFCSTVNTIVECGAIPVFCDIDIKTGLMDLSKVENLITPKTKVILPVYYGGQCVNIDELTKIANKYNLKVLADCAHAFGTYYKGEPVGSFGDACAFSFYATKNISTGEGGMLALKNKDDYNKAKELSLHGMSRDAFNRYSDESVDYKYDVLDVGYKYNLSDINSSIGLAQLSHFDEMQKKRRLLAHIYDEELKSINGVTAIEKQKNCESSYHLYVVKIGDNFPLSRDELFKQLKTYKISTSVHFIPVHSFTYYKNFYKGEKLNLNHTEEFFNEILSLPLYPDMKKEEVLYVTEAIREIAEKNAKQ